MVPLYKPYLPKDVFPEIEKIYQSGNYTFGKYGQLFEKQLQNFIGTPYILVVNSYNMASLIAISTLGLKPGDEIIASPMSCLASNQPFITKQVKIIWADVNPETGTLCPDDVRKKIGKKTKAILHNHFCGYLGDLEQINSIGAHFGIPVIDDGIEAFGAKYFNQYLGNVGSDLTIFSFQTVRIPNTIDGGAICFKSEKNYEKAKKIRDYGINRSLFRTNDGEINANFDIDSEGYGGMLNEINSFVGTKQMLEIDSILKMQHSNAKIWDLFFENDKALRPLNIHSNSTPNYWVYGLMSENKKQSIQKFKDLGFEASGVHYKNNHYSIFKNSQLLPGVEKFYDQFFAIPCGWWLNNTFYEKNCDNRK